MQCNSQEHATLNLFSGDLIIGVGCKTLGHQGDLLCQRALALVDEEHLTDVLCVILERIACLILLLNALRWFLHQLSNVSRPACRLEPKSAVFVIADQVWMDGKQW